MVEILKTLRDTPLPSLLVIGGLVFLLIPFLRGSRGSIEIDTTNRGFATFLGAILLMGGIGLYILPAFVSVPSTNTATEPPTTSPVVSQYQTPNSPSISPTANQQVLQSPCASESTQVKLGLWEWHGNRPPMPSPAGACQVIFANGDIDNSGTCLVKEFGAGISVEGLGEGRFELWLLTGMPEQIVARESIIQQGSASDPNNFLGTCPRLP